MKQLILIAAAAVFLSGCLKTNDEEQVCNYDECALKAPPAETEGVKAYLSGQGITATEHCSGLYYAIDTVGTGAAPTACSAIAIRYKGTLTDGSVFESNSITARLDRLIPGWRNGLPKIKQGGRMRLYIPPTLGYGAEAQIDRSTGNVVIPANSILIFDIKLDAVGR